MLLIRLAVQRERAQWALRQRRQLSDSPKTVSAGLIGKEPLINPWMISGIECPVSTT